MISKIQASPANQHGAAPRAVQPLDAKGKSRRVANLASLIAGLGLGVALALELKGTTVNSLQSADSLLSFLGRITAMVGTYGVIITLFLIARIPWLEREVGFDKTVYWHRKIAPYALFLIGFHVLFTLGGFALASNSNILSEWWLLLTGTRWILPATAGFVLMMAAGITSYKLARNRISYETWWVIHLYTYLAVVLSFAHQVSIGSAFMGEERAATVWLGLTALSIGSIVWFRWLIPIVRGFKYRLRVHAVISEGPGVVSIWLTGRNLKKMNAVAGQFFCWRFLTSELWWHSNPYSLSAPPDGKYLRITVKDLGDQSGAIAQIKPGTKVLAEGPYGAFTAGKRNGDKVVLIAGGVGITPVRAVLEQLPVTAKAEVFYRARATEDIVLKRELDKLSERPNTTVRYLIGSRSEFPLDARSLLRLSPDIQNSDVYVCGPESLTNSVLNALEILEVPKSHIHDEAFAF